LAILLAVSLFLNGRFPDGVPPNLVYLGNWQQLQLPGAGHVWSLAVRFLPPFYIGWF
jgi:hypothetical protein